MTVGSLPYQIFASTRLSPDEEETYYHNCTTPSALLRSFRAEGVVFHQYLRLGLPWNSQFGSEPRSFAALLYLSRRETKPVGIPRQQTRCGCPGQEEDGELRCPILAMVRLFGVVGKPEGTV